LLQPVTIHKSQGPTLPKAWIDQIDIGTSEKLPGIAYAALSRVQNLSFVLLREHSFFRRGGGPEESL